MKHFQSTILLLLVLVFVSCNTIDVYEKTAAVPHHEWNSNNRLSFAFQAKDSNAYYNIYLVLRHSESYHFNNLWIDLSVAEPGKKTQTQRLNLTLAGADGWLGTAMDDIIEQRILLFAHPTKLTAGNYTFTLQQIMREEPLQNILNAGIRVEKVVQ